MCLWKPFALAEKQLSRSVVIGLGIEMQHLERSADHNIANMFDNRIGSIESGTFNVKSGGLLQVRLGYTVPTPYRRVDCAA